LPVALGVALLMAGCAEESAEDRIRKAKVIGSTELVLSSWGIIDLTPLAELTYLDLDNNNLTDLTPLAGLTELTVLRLGGNQITDVTPLEGLTNLTKLFIYDNKVAELAPLAELKNLETLWLDGNPIPEDGKEMLEKALPNCFIDISRTP